MKPLARCCNGCDAAPWPPSKVLCKKCLDELSGKFGELAKRFGVDDEQERTQVRVENAPIR